MKRFFKKPIVIISALAVLSLTLFSFQKVNNYFEISKNLEIFADIYKEVNTYYVDEVDPGKLMRRAIDEMLSTLDPYTNYISEAEIEDYRFQMTGQYGGIGALIGTRGDFVVISDPYDGFPAQKADLRAGDIILEVDGKSAKGKTSDDMSKLLKGSPGTKVELLIERKSVGQIKKELVREEITVKNVPYYGMIDQKTGYIKLTNFTRDAGLEVKKALVELKKNEQLSSVVLDLRFNPGGLLHEAINVVNVFVPKNQLVVSTKGKVKDWDKTYKTLNAPVDTEIPVVVLINSNSASASEIVSGTLQDLDRGVVVGERSYGKGLVQTTRPLNYGTQLKVTTAKYYTPSGRCIQAIDYSNRRDDGSVGTVPDSLIKEFKTSNGRIVYDGGGVKPDVEVEEEKYSNIAASLIAKYHLFDYATIYRNTHESIASAKEFHLTDEEFQDFLTYIVDKDYDYVTKTEKALKELEKKASDENYIAALQPHLDQLRNELKHDKQSDVQKHKAEIVELLESEIARRYYFQKAAVETTFDDDKDIAAALKLFSDMSKYRGILENAN